MTLIKSSIICFSIMVVGCSTSNGHKTSWPLPTQPKNKHVEIIATEDISNEKTGFYLSHENAANLAYSVDELKKYIEKLELLVKEMAKYHNIKLEVVRNNE